MTISGIISCLLAPGAGGSNSQPKLFPNFQRLTLAPLEMGLGPLLLSAGLHLVQVHSMPQPRKLSLGLGTGLLFLTAA